MNDALYNGDCLFIYLFCKLLNYMTNILRIHELMVSPNFNWNDSQPWKLTLPLTLLITVLELS